MRALLTTILILFSTTVLAKTAWYYDVDRSGEGIVLTEIDDGRIAFAFYSHTADLTGSVPIPSPSPPPPKYCDLYTVWFTGTSIGLIDGFAYGKVKYDVAVPEFPAARIDGAVSDSVIVGDFILWREGDGFSLYMESNHLMCDLSVFGVEHHFTTKLTE